MRLRLALLAATGIALSTGAYAQAPGQPIDGFYVHAGVGYNYLDSVPLDSLSVRNATTNIDVQNKSINYGSGITSEIGPGYGFGNGLRIDLNGGFSFNDVNQNGSGRICTSNCNPNQANLHSGREQKYGLLVNGYYDFVDALGAGVTPYVGAGVGFQNITQDNLSVTGYLPSGRLWHLTGNNNSQNVFAYDAVAGVRFSLESIDPALAVYAEYRFLGTAGNRTYNTHFVTQGYTSNQSATLGNEYNHSFIMGVLYSFNSPRPPPPPPPPPAPPPPPPQARTYLVFFDWDRADLSDRARQIVAEAASASTHQTTTQLEVNGYTDLSGTPAYNQKLSVRRARTVQAELIKDGVAANEIEIHGYGESNPLVPTAPGVREPQNRRVEIILK
jgi:outer membrane protein OmpA-like peptidoglycan-associated protein